LAGAELVRSLIVVDNDGPSNKSCRHVSAFTLARIVGCYRKNARGGLSFGVFQLDNQRLQMSNFNDQP
jgi:hypothetical protein